MIKKTVVGFVVLLVAAIGGWYVLSASSTSRQTETIKVGALASLTGDAAAYGEAARNVMQLAADEINTNGGVNGKLIDLIIEDSRCSGQDAVNATQKLISIDKVQVIIGGFCSSESLAIVPIAARAKVALLSPGSSSPDLTNISSFFARDYPSDVSQGAVLADVAYTDKGWRNVAFIQEQTDYALGVYKAFSARFTELGGLTTDEQFQSGTTDFHSTITKVRAENPDAVFLSTQGPASAKILLQQMQQIGWSPRLLLIDTVIDDPGTIQNNKTILEGALGAEFGVDLNNSKFAALLASYKAKYGADMPYQSYGQTEYDSVYLVRDAIAAVGYDGTKIARWLRNVHDWQGASGSVTIGSDGDRVGAHKPETIVNGVVEPYAK